MILKRSRTRDLAWWSPIFSHHGDITGYSSGLYYYRKLSHEQLPAVLDILLNNLLMQFPLGQTYCLKLAVVLEIAMSSQAFAKSSSPCNSFLRNHLLSGIELLYHGILER